MNVDLKDDFKKLELAQAKRLEKMKAQLGMNAHSIDTQNSIDKQSSILSTTSNKRVQFQNGGPSQDNGLFPPDDMQLGVSATFPLKSGDQSKKSLNKMESGRKDNDDRIARLEKENERLQTTLAEKQAEIKRLEKRVEEDAMALAGDGSKLEADTAASRIVELSRRIRELNADLEAEKARSKKASMRVRELENQVTDKSTSKPDTAKTDEQEGAAKLRDLETKLRSTEKRLAEARAENSKQAKDLQLATYVLRRELGENFQLNAARLNDESSWRGRAQQIAILNERVRELETLNTSLRNSIAARRIDDQRATLDELIDELANPNANRDAPDPNESMTSGMSSTPFAPAITSVMSGATSLGLDAIGDDRSQSFLQPQKTATTLISETKQKELLRRIDRDRKEQIEKLEADLKAAREENSTLKERVANQKGRHASLKQETNVQREQIETLLAKARHDDELIATLMQQHAALKSNIDRIETDASRLRAELETMRDSRRSAEREASQIEAALRRICEEKQAEIDQLRQAVQGTASAPRRLDREVDFGADSGADSRIPVPVSRLSSKQHTRTESASSSVPASVAALRSMTPRGRAPLPINVEELNALLRTSEIERNRLTELVRVLETRHSDAQTRLLAAQRTASALQVRQVALEKQLERQRVVMREGPKGVAASGGKATLLRGNNASEAQNATTEANADLEMQLARIAEQLDVEKEDNVTLQRRIDELTNEKDADFTLLSRIVEETKRVFVEAIRKLNDEKSTSRPA